MTRALRRGGSGACRPNSKSWSEFGPTSCSNSDPASRRGGPSTSWSPVLRLFCLVSGPPCLDSPSPPVREVESPDWDRVRADEDGYEPIKDDDEDEDEANALPCKDEDTEDDVEAAEEVDAASGAKLGVGGV